MKKQTLYLAGVVLLFMQFMSSCCCSFMLAGSCDGPCASAGLSGDFGIAIGPGHKEATEESWNIYGESAGIPDRVQDIQSDAVTAFDVNLDLTLRLAENLDFNPGIGFSQGGAKSSGTFGTSGSTIEFFNTQRLSMIEVPLNFTYWFDNIFIQLGPQPAFVVGSKWSEMEDGTEITGNNKEDINSFLFGLTGSVGYFFKDSGFGIFVTHEEGLNTIYSTDYYSNNVRLRSTSIGIVFRPNGRVGKPKPPG